MNKQQTYKISVDGLASQDDFPRQAPRNDELSYIKYILPPLFTSSFNFVIRNIRDSPSEELPALKGQKQTVLTKINTIVDIVK